MGNENNQTHTYTVREAAQKTGLTVHTLRYYERIGLLDPPERGMSSGHRQYGEDDLRRVQFLKRLRSTGMAIREMQRFVNLYRCGDATLAEREKMMVDHRCHVLAQIADFEESLVAIEYKITSYQKIGSEQYWPNANKANKTNKLDNSKEKCQK